MVRTIALLSTLLVTSAAQANWQYTKWGMSPKELLALGNGKIVTASPGEAAPNVTEYKGHRVTTMTLNTAGSNDVIHLNSTPAGMTLNVNSNAGGDNLFFGNGNVDADMRGPINLNAHGNPQVGTYDAYHYVGRRLVVQRQVQGTAGG